MIEPMEGFAIVKKQKLKLIAMNIYNNSQRDDVILDSDEYTVDIEVKVIPKKKEMKF